MSSRSFSDDLNFPTLEEAVRFLKRFVLSVQRITGDLWKCNAELELCHREFTRLYMEIIDPVYESLKQGDVITALKILLRELFAKEVREGKAEKILEGIKCRKYKGRSKVKLYLVNIFDRKKMAVLTISTPHFFEVIPVTSEEEVREVVSDKDVTKVLEKLREVKAVGFET